jgi:hypothetical protein
MKVTKLRVNAQVRLTNLRVQATYEKARGTAAASDHRRQLELTVTGRVCKPASEGADRRLARRAAMGATAMWAGRDSTSSSLTRRLRLRSSGSEVQEPPRNLN